jgi:hypothetical protein
VLRLRKPLMSYWSTAGQTVKVRADTIYRISLDARGPEGGAADYLRAELYTPDRDLPWSQKEPLGLMAYPDQIGQDLPNFLGPDWRHFEWTFKTPADIDGNTMFRVYTRSERPIEVCNVRFAESNWDRPRAYKHLSGQLGGNTHLYALLAELAPRKPGDPPVAIYENRGFAWLYGRPVPRFDPTTVRKWSTDSEYIEHLKWQVYIPITLVPDQGPAVGVEVECHPTAMLFGTAAGGIFYMIVLAAVGFAAAARRRE